MSHLDNSGSEDGQLRSPTDEILYSNDLDIEDGDTDSLDIKPPQATHRDMSTSSRRTKPSKEKKHSKEHKHKDRERERMRDRERQREEYYKQKLEKARHNSDDRGRHRHLEIQKHREQRHEIREKHNEGSYRGRNEIHQQQYNDRLANSGNDVRYQEYEHSIQNHGRTSKQSRGNSREDKSRRIEYPISSQTIAVNRAESREKRKYLEVQPSADPEKELEDLRSRLLSKRSKFEKKIAQSRYDDISSDERQHSSHHSNRPVKEHKKNKHFRNDGPVIEVIDSPEEIQDQRRKSNKLPTPENEEHVARRSKLLEAEREMAWRKEIARGELEARREKREKEIEKSEALNQIISYQRKKKRRHDSEEEQEERRRHRHHKKKLKKTKERLKENDLNVQKSPAEEGEYEDRLDDEYEQQSAYSTGEEDVNAGLTAEDDDDDDFEMSSEEDNDNHEEKAMEIIAERREKNVRKKRRKHHRHSTERDDEGMLSVEELEKSQPKTDHSIKISSRSNSRSSSPAHSEHSKNSRFHSKSQSRSRSVSRYRTSSISRSHTRSRTNSHSRSRSRSVSKSRSSRSRSRTRTSRSRSEDSDRSRQSTSRSRSRSKSRSRSRSGSASTDEERDKKKVKKNMQNSSETETKLDSKDERDTSPRNDKGEKLPNYFPGIQGCRSVEEFQCLNRIEEGTYGVVYRAKDRRTDEIVALKRLKMEKEKEGFPITSLREINTLLKGQHPNIVTVREIVVGSNMDKIFIVMDYVEHDLKSLMETMKHKEQSFLPGEVKCLLQQLLRAVGHLHDNWILHRDLKTSNLLLSHKGILKVGDFGLAREYGSPLKAYTSLVVTLWYRAPELLLCSKEYSTPIDMWSVGCIFAEFMQMSAMFPGKSEIDQLNRIFKDLGTPNEKIWPGYKDLPAVQNLLSQNSSFSEYPVSNLRRKFYNKTTEVGVSLLQGLLTYDPKQRLTAEQALRHAYFKEIPLAIDPSMFPTWPAKSELGKAKALASSPKPPSGGSQFKQLGRDDIMVPPGELKSAKAAAKAAAAAASAAVTKSAGFVLNAGIDQRSLAMGPGFSLKF
ncbi:serine/threonine-protein kinase PITSLRE isoform X2 [Condylostylus longicornis]|uniref:serine/threonine-protein kinase PITSLRE isoform X2 n=1 Tax=Condylostylus longicornis TaxID=2530218 RepID=UPI00244E28E3|nr:serine/threonine-protein kinase PITSLRE isoform X2 [Condylostylus longicornis]